tara:strand:- start:23548 stop:24498 length:951 start_codon:yes stop_codon:yes gene_type:complete
MAGLFGYKQNPRTADMFSNMSAGQRFGEAVGNARNADIARKRQGMMDNRQFEMDDLTKQYKQAQVRNLDTGGMYGNRRPTSLQEMDYLFDPETTQEMKDVYWLNRRKPEFIRGDVAGDTGITPLNPDGTPKERIVQSTAEENIANVVDETTQVEQAKDTVDFNNKALTESYQAYNKIQESRLNGQKGIAALDAGAESGFVESFLPSIRAASIELDNVQRRMGLDVVGNTTFGALSKGELELALAVALPTNLEPEALREWLVKKDEAQEKLSKYVMEAMVHLSGGGNMIDFLKDRGNKYDLQQEGGVASKYNLAPVE